MCSDTGATLSTLAGESPLTHPHTLIQCLLLVPPPSERIYLLDAWLSPSLALSPSPLSLRVYVCMCVCIFVCLICVFVVQATGQQPHQLHRRWSFPSAARFGDSVSTFQKSRRFSTSLPLLLCVLFITQLLFSFISFIQNILFQLSTLNCPPVHFQFCLHVFSHGRKCCRCFLLRKMSLILIYLCCIPELSCTFQVLKGIFLSLTNVASLKSTDAKAQSDKTVATTCAASAACASAHQWFPQRLWNALMLPHVCPCVRLHSRGLMRLISSDLQVFLCEPILEKKKKTKTCSFRWTCVSSVEDWASVSRGRMSRSDFQLKWQKRLFKDHAATGNTQGYRSTNGAAR